MRRYSGAKAVLADVQQNYADMGWITCVGASGTVQALQEIMIAQGAASESPCPSCWSSEPRQNFVWPYRATGPAGLGARTADCISPDRPAILIAIFETLNIDNMTLTGGALREGLIYGMVGRKRDFVMRGNVPPRV